MSVKNAINLILIIAYCLVYLQHSEEQKIFLTNFKPTTNSPMLLSADLLSQNSLYYHQLLHFEVCGDRNVSETSLILQYKAVQNTRIEILEITCQLYN